MIVVQTNSEAETASFAARLAARIREAIDRSELEWIVIGLSGALGAGKTAFVRGFVSALDPVWGTQVTSPSYAIAQHYATRPPVRHLDLYRLTTLEDLEAIGYRELYFAPGVALVEWIETVAEAIPSEWLEISLAVDPTDVREIRVRPHGARLERIVRGVSG